MSDDTIEYDVQGSNDSEIRSRSRLHKRTGRELTRKRSRDESLWKKNKRKRLRQSGQAYIDSRAKQQPAKVVKTCKSDHTICRNQCAKHFDDEQRQIIHNVHWSLNDLGKRHFYSSTTSMSAKSRVRRAANPNHKKNTYTYCFKKSGQKIRVCKEFYLFTLNISEKRVRNYHSTKNEMTGVPSDYRRGKTPSNAIDKSVKDKVREHISSIPRVESHYCRRESNKEYVAGNLSIQLCYEKYVAKCVEENLPKVKLSMYTSIFNNEFNIEFHALKKDRCDICESFKHLHDIATAEQKTKYKSHIESREATKQERTSDRENKDQCVICFDLQNVFALPNAEVSNFFYKRKLSVYNLTAHCSLTKQSYGAVWTENMSGRSGNDIASALVAILHKIVQDNPLVTELVLWSDSCVPQNKNSLMSSALILFMQDHPTIKVIVQKFCEPGHSDIQEIDNIHSQIESGMQNCEIYSPVGLLRVLRTLPRRKPMTVLQLKKNDMKDYQATSKGYKFATIPYTKVKTILYLAEQPYKIQYKKKFSTGDWIKEDIRFDKKTRKSKKMNDGKELNVGEWNFSKPKLLKIEKNVLSKEKKRFEIYVAIYAFTR